MTRASLTILPPRGEDDRLHGAWLHHMQWLQRSIYAMESYLEARTPEEKELAGYRLAHAETMACGTCLALFDAYRDAKADEEKRPAA